jgi:hypothetical protein
MCSYPSICRKEFAVRTPEPSEERPVYRKVAHEENSATQRYMIVCDEGWRESIVCEGMYEWAADWLLNVIGRRRYAGGRP